jgi:signal transduction histidine kinase
MFIKVISYRSWLLKVSRLLTAITAALLLACCTHADVEIPDHPTQVDAILDHTNDFLNSGEIIKAKFYLDSAYQTIFRPGTVDLWKKYDHKVNFYLNYENNTGLARVYADSMAYMVKDKAQKYKDEYAKSIFAHSEVLLAEKRYTEAFNSYYKGKVFANAYLDSCSFQEFTYKLGMVRYNQGEYLKAVVYFKQAFAEGRSCRISYGFNKAFLARQSNLNTIALCYERTGRLDSAIHYYKKALSFIDANGGAYPMRKDFMLMAKGVILGNLGGTLAAQGEFAQAEKYLRESIRINDRPLFELTDAQTAKVKLVELYLKTTRLKEAEKLLDELHHHLSAQPGKNAASENIRLKWYKLNWQLLDQRGQPFGAYHFSMKYHVLQDSINRVTAGYKEVDMDELFKDNQQQYELALLNKDNQLKKSYLIGTILLSVLAFVLLGMVWFNLKHSRNLNKKMAAQNEQLQMALGSLEQSQQENTNLMKVVAHDLRNPVGGMTSLAEIMLAEQGRSEEDITMLELIYTSGKHSLELVNNLLISNTLIKEPEKNLVDLYQMLHYCVNLLVFKADQKKQKLVLNALHASAMVNREKMWRVVSNLIANAIKFSPEGAEIRIQMELQASKVLISVEDHGIGIPKEIKEKVFDMFTEAKREGTHGEQPFGLGLAISKQIVEAHGGRIWFESVDGQGTTFYVELPANHSPG